MPLAKADADAVTEGGTETGNVVTGVGTTAGAANADVAGADGFPVGGAVVGVRAAGLDTTTAVATGVGGSIAGLYGTLTLDALGNYSYHATANAIITNQVDVFVYTVKDGDGDLSTTTLTLNVANVTLAADNQTRTVNEAALDTAVAGSDLGAGTITGSAPALATETVIGQLAVAGATGYVAQSITTTYGLFSLTSTGAYTYTLTKPYTTSPGANDGAVVPAGGFETLGYTAQDAGGNTVTGTITINIQDDVPSFGTVQNQQTDNITTAPYVAVGTLHFTSGADGFGAVTGITASTTATSSGFGLVYNTVGNVLTAYQDANSNGVYNALTDTTQVFTLTVDPTATPPGQPVTNHAGTYTFDLITALDNGIVQTAIGGATTFGAGPAGEQELTGGSPTQNLAILSGFSSSQTTAALAFNQAFWTQQQVNSSVAGFGVNNNNLDAQEIFISDFHEANAPGVVLPPLQTDPFGPLIAYATYTFPGFGSGDAVFYQAHYENNLGVATGTSAITQLTGAELTGTLTVTAAVGTYLDYVVFFDQSGGGKFKLTNTGTLSTTINQTITFTTSAKDGDGDIATTAAFTVNVKNGLTPLTPVAPIVFDLTGDGFHFVSWSAGVAFDYTGSGALVTTAWAGSDDAILAIDLNGNGRVDSGAEIVFGGNGLTDLQGLAATYDSNHDGVLDAKDAAFAQFGVWQDANGNGVSDPGEFRTLTQAGITSISLVSDGKSYTAANGDVIVAGQATFTRADGSAGIVADASFATSAMDKIAAKSAEIVATTLAAAAAVTTITAAAAATPDATSVPAAVVHEASPVEAVQHAMPSTSEAQVIASSLFDDQSAKAAAPASEAQHLSDPAPAAALGSSFHVASTGDAAQAVAASHPAFTLPTNLSGAMDALLTMAAQAGPLPDKVTAALPSVVAAIRDGTAAQAVDALIDHFAPAAHAVNAPGHIDISALFAAVANDPGLATLAHSFDFSQAIHDITAAMAAHG